MLSVESSEPGDAVRAEAIPTLCRLLKILCPNVVGYELRSLPKIVLEGAERIANREQALRERYEHLLEEYEALCATTEAHAAHDAEGERIRKTLLFISQETALSGETCRLIAQDTLGGFVERGEQ